MATFLGKASIFATMVLYAMEAAERFGVPGSGTRASFGSSSTPSAGIVAVSMLDKAAFLRRLFGRSV